MIDQTKLTAFERLGGEAKVREISGRFYDAMDAHEPALAALHRLDEAGKVHPEAREKFALFFIGWLGGPQTYVAQHGHPRLRMRHAGVLVSPEMRDAWMRAMTRALGESGVEGDLRTFMEEKLGDVATMLRNTPG